ncbi:MAG: hypothetical protein H6837_15280 [Planctomycetes bacterium]|nr:hypothetical protein [Planctomycetota bacterium]
MPRLLGAAIVIAMLVVVSVDGAKQPRQVGYITTYCGRDGVIEYSEQNGNMLWDGLWHSSLSKAGNHVGTNNWALAVLPVICHTGDVEDALVIGLGTGITAATLAKRDSIKRVDAYEINHTLKHLLRRHPEGTLNVATNPKIRVIWQDARSGMALNTRKYDVISQQPLWLMQAGSSILLSREYMQLVASRLKPGGIFAIYCNSPSPEQKLVVRKTAASVFRYRESFGEGYCLIVSNDPIEFSEEKILARAAREEDPFWRELSAGKIPLGYDAERLEWEDCPILITDDHPVVEYTEEVIRMVRSR